MLKPHRILARRVSLYADEAAAFLRRRRHSRREYVHIARHDGTGLDLPLDSEPAAGILAAARDLLRS